jgi:hypothetical protein
LDVPVSSRENHPIFFTPLRKRPELDERTPKRPELDERAPKRSELDERTPKKAGTG